MLASPTFCALTRHSRCPPPCPPQNGRAPAAKDTRASTSTNRNILGYEEVDTVADVAAVHKKLLAEVSAVPGTENPFYVVDLGDVHR